MLLLHNARILDLTDGSTGKPTDVLLSDRVLALGPEAQQQAHSARVRSIDLGGR
ncbi:hydrolase, partial [Salmonella enterica subsp. enterica serovar Typhimurium]|nr:hydrolase [Salmonella enterica subsp. enterica serovar Typhimurium]